MMEGINNLAQSVVVKMELPESEAELQSMVKAGF